MASFAKSILVALFVVTAILMFTNIVFFFPWYMTIVVETFNISQIVASDNYLKDTYYYDTLYRMQEQPVFRENPHMVLIDVENAYGREARGNDDETMYYHSNDWDKPYLQRGESLMVRVQAVYPFKITIWGEAVGFDVPFSFSLKTTGLKHYKDLDYYY